MRPKEKSSPTNGVPSRDPISPDFKEALSLRAAKTLGMEKVERRVASFGTGTAELIK